jgi:hypothetical protein
VDVAHTLRTHTDKSFIDAFFMTYRTFASPEQLLKQLISRYTTPTALMHAKDHNLVKMRYAPPPSAARRRRRRRVLTTWPACGVQGV